MPTYREGNMFDHMEEAHCIYVTTNATIKKNGELVMGRGAALEAKNRFPELPKKLGAVLSAYAQYLRVSPPALVYGIADFVGYPKVGAFQVKHHYRDRASLALIVNSLSCLLEATYNADREVFFLNFPGIGNGGLDREAIAPYVDKMLPNNVHVWTL